VILEFEMLAGSETAELRDRPSGTSKPLPGFFFFSFFFLFFFFFFFGAEQSTDPADATTLVPDRREGTECFHPFLHRKRVSATDWLFRRHPFSRGGH